MQNRSDIKEFILLIERDFSVNSWKINSTHLWPILRIHLFFYLINKIVRALLLIKKIDEDYWMEFDEILGKIDDKVHENRYLEKLFINNGIDFNWLQSENLPENLDLIIKNIKSQGFLR